MSDLGKGDLDGNGVIVIENAIPKIAQDAIEQMLLQPSFAWFFNLEQVDTTSGSYKGLLTDRKFAENYTVRNGHQFTHLFFRDGTVQSSFYETVVLPLLLCVPFAIGEVLKAKANLILNPGPVPKTSIGMPHTDFFDLTTRYMTALYYVNDSDGDTVLFHERGKNAQFDLHTPLTTLKTVPPKKGSMVIFDGDRIHASGVPQSSSTRAVINLNFILREYC